MTKVNRKHKDSLFRLLFNNRKDLLSLYNAVNHTDYENEEDLEINTLENVIYLKMKNDVSFVFNLYLNLYEHQASLNPNMPLRNLFYVSDLLQAIIVDENIYSDTLVSIPTPRFVVFYNGEAKMAERMVLRLSDSFSCQEENPELELKVVVYNINKGMNPELLEGCRTLREYMQFVQLFRENLQQYDKETAAKLTVRTCMEDNVLVDFLKKHRAEAIAMCLYEYDEEKHMEMERREHYERGKTEGKREGKKEGMREGIKEGMKKGIKEEALRGIQILIKQCRRLNEPDEAIVQVLMEEYQITEKEAKAYLEKE